MVKFVPPTAFEASQQNHARRGFSRALPGRPVPNNRNWSGVTVGYQDMPTPQAFPTRPAVRYAAESAAVGTDSVGMTLPGRVAVSWDGEMGASAPNIGDW